MKTKSILFCTSALALLAPAAARAQDAQTAATGTNAAGTNATGSGNATGEATADAGSNTGLAEIVVTAQKREENLQRTAASVQVINAGSLVDRGVTDIVRLSTQVSGLIIQPTRAGVYMFSRGLGQADAQYQTSPAIEMQQDGLTLPRSAQQFALIDIGNIQVLKGPQGILYGRYGIGGAVLVNSKRPTYDRIKADGYFEYGNYDLTHGFAAVNLPVSDSAGFRAAIDYNKHDGYTTNGQNDLDQLSGRIAFQADPTDRLTIFLNATGAHRKGKGFAQANFPRAVEANGDPFYIIPVPQSAAAAATATPAPAAYQNFDDYHNRGFFNQKTYLLNGELTYEVADNLKFSFATGYFDNNSDMVNAFENKTGTVALNYATTDYVEKSWDLQNEARLTFERDGITAIFGALQHRFKARDQIVQLAYRAGPAVNGPHDPTENNYAVFGDVVVPLGERLRVEAGARQSWDIKHDKGTLSGAVVDINSSNFPEFKNFSWKIGAEYDLTDKILTYANVQTGYLPGAYQTATAAVLTSLGLPRRYDSQTVTAYQAGFKSRFFDNRVQLNVEGFYYDYKNYQVTQRIADPANPNNFQSPYANIKKSRIFGADIDLNARIIQGGTATIGLSLLNTKIIDSGFTKLSVFQVNGQVRNELGQNGFPALDPSLHGYDLPFAPHVMFNLGYEQIIELGGGSQLVANAATHHESSKWLDYTHSPIFPGRHPAFWKTDVSLTYKAPDNRWNVSVWGRNLEDTATYSSFTPAQLRVGGALVGAYSNVYLDAPRTYGVRVGFNF